MPVEAGQGPDACRGGEVRRVLKASPYNGYWLGGPEEEGREESRWTGEDGEARWQEGGGTSPLPCLSHWDFPRGFPTGGRGFFAKRLS